MREYLDNKIKAQEAARRIFQVSPVEFFSGSNATILFCKVWNPWVNDYDAYGEWIGGDITAITEDALKGWGYDDLAIGQVISLADVKIELVEHAESFKIWYAKKAEP
jgi:hypothetical protein